MKQDVMINNILGVNKCGSELTLQQEQAAQTPP